MDGVTGDSDKKILKQHLEKVQRQERWLFSEKLSKKQSLFEISEEVVDESADIIHIINTRNQQLALRKALAQLETADRNIIEEYYFGTSRRTQLQLARLHNISRQAYAKKLNKAVDNLRVIFVSVYEEF